MMLTPAAVLAILERHRGQQTAIKGAEIAVMLGQRNDRRVRLIIRDLISQGHPIASSTEEPAGYYLVSSWQEAESYRLALRSRVIEDCKRIRDFRQAARLSLSGSEQMKLC